MAGPPRERPAPSPEVAGLTADGRKIEAMKLYREETGLGLAAAKEVVDALSGSATRAGIEPESPADRRSRRAAAFLAATILGFGGVGVTGTGLYRAHVAASWPSARGEIVESRLATGASGRLDLEYTYEVGGRVHRGSRISYTRIQGAFFARAAEYRYARGTRVTVRYDPSDPTQSVLEVRAPTPYLMVFLVSLCALAWGTARWIQEAQRERAGVGRSRDPPSRSRAADGA